MSFGSVWRSLLLIVCVILSWAVVVGIGKIGEMFFTYLVFPIHITWPMWLLFFLFFGVFFHARSIEENPNGDGNSR